MKMDDGIRGKIFSDIETAHKFTEEFALQNTHPLKHASRTTVSQ